MRMIVRARVRAEAGTGLFEGLFERKTCSRANDDLLLLKDVIIVE
jgi:hypothetical protein